MSDSFANPWTVAHQAPLCMEFSRQEYWSSLPFPSPGDLPNLEREPGSCTLLADSLLSGHQARETLFESLGLASKPSQNSPQLK